jgi:hypothetical protein
MAFILVQVGTRVIARRFLPKQSSRMHDWCGFKEIASLRNARDDRLNRRFRTDIAYQLVIQNLRDGKKHDHRTSRGKKQRHDGQSKIG